jgi:hypothetical protein
MPQVPVPMAGSVDDYVYFGNIESKNNKCMTNKRIRLHLIYQKNVPPIHSENADVGRQ